MKAVRIEIEYEDGTIKRAIGDDADAICQWQIDAVMFQGNHGILYNGPVMQEITEKAPCGCVVLKGWRCREHGQG